MYMYICHALFIMHVTPVVVAYQHSLMHIHVHDVHAHAVMWQAIIQNHGGSNCITEALDLSSLAKISDGYSAGHIEKSVSTVLSERRVQQVRYGVHVQMFVCTCMQ